MPYSCEFHRNFQKVTQREKNKDIVRSCDEAVLRILQNPSVGSEKKGRAKDLYGYGFNYNSTSYRIYYFVYECCTDESSCIYEKKHTEGECSGVVRFVFWGIHAEGDRFLAKEKKALQALKNTDLLEKRRDKF